MLGIFVIETYSYQMVMFQVIHTINLKHIWANYYNPKRELKANMSRNSLLCNHRLGRPIGILVAMICHPNFFKISSQQQEAMVEVVDPKKK